MRRKSEVRASEAGTPGEPLPLPVARRWVHELMRDMLHEQPTHTTIQFGVWEGFSTVGDPFVEPVGESDYVHTPKASYAPHVEIRTRRGRVGREGELRVQETICAPGYLEAGSQGPFLNDGDPQVFGLAELTLGTIPVESHTVDYGLRFTARNDDGIEGMHALPYAKSANIDHQVTAEEAAVVFMREHGFGHKVAGKPRDPLYWRDETDRLETILLLGACMQEAGVWDMRELSLGLPYDPKG